MASQAVLELIANLKDNASAGIDSIGGALSSLGTVAAGVAVAGVVALGAALVSGIGDAREAQMVMAQTENTIRATGGAAGVSAQHVADFAASLSAASGKSLFGDTQYQDATNLLLTFKNIKGETLDLATVLTGDLAQALGGAPADQAMMLGKALDNPTKGMSALSKAGLTFTEEQKAQVEAMQAAGDMAGAQAIVIAELNSQVGGSAAAAAAADGGWAQFRDRMGEAKETAGAALLPMLMMLAGVLNDTVMPIVEAAAATFAQLIAAFQEEVDSGGGILGAVAYAVQAVTGFDISPLTNGLAVIGDVLTNIVLPALSEFASFLNDTVLPAVGAGLTDAFAFLSGTVLPALTQAWADLQPAITTVIAFIGDNLQPILYGLAAIFLTVVVPAFVAWAAAAGTAALATVAALAPVIIPLAAIGAAVALLKAAWDSDFGGIRTTLTAFWQQTGQPIFTALAGWLGTTIPAAVSTVSGFFAGTLWPALQKVWAFIDANILPILGALANVWIALVKKEIELLAALWSNVLWPALEKVGTFISGTLMPVLSALAQDAMNGAKVASDALAGVVNTVLGPAFQWLNNNVIGPVTAGFGHISSAVGDVIGFLKRLADSISAIEIPSWLQGHSPPPLADWFDFIGTSIGRVATTALPSFQTALTQAGGTIAGVAGSIGGPFADAIGEIGRLFGDSDAPDDAEDLGGDILAGLAEGMADGVARAIRIGQAAIEDIGAGMEDAAETGSPSQMTWRIGDDLLAGLILGMTAGQADLADMTAGLIAQIEADLGTLRASLEDAGGDARAAIQAGIDQLESQIDGIVAAAERLPDLLAAATEGMFRTTANVFRQQEQNLDKLGDISADAHDAYRGMVEEQLAAAEAAAQLIPDPAEAAEFFRLRSKQIFELVALEKQQGEAMQAERKKITDEHAQFLQKQVADQIKLQDSLTKNAEDAAQRQAALDTSLTKSKQDAAADVLKLQTDLAGAKTPEQAAAIQAKIDAVKLAAAEEQKRITDQMTQNAAAAAAERQAIQEKIADIQEARDTELRGYQDAITANEALAVQERARIQQRIVLVKQAQIAEQEALRLHQENDQSIFEELATGLQTLIAAIPSSITLPPSWAATIAAYRDILTQLNTLYGRPPPAVFLPPPAPIGGNALGTDFWRGGLTWVGERGPELIDAPRGSQIIPNGESERMAGGVTFQSGAIQLTLPNTSETEARRFVDRVIGEIDRRRKGRG